MTLRRVGPLSCSLIGAAISACLLAHSVPAQTVTPASQAPAARADPVLSAAVAINDQRDRAYRSKDLEALTALYTEDANYIELLPTLLSMHGRAEIKLHFQELFDTNASDLATSVRKIVEGGDSALVTGDYSLVANNRLIVGHFVQVLRREGGAWKIAQHIFARPEMITESELHDSGSD